MDRQKVISYRNALRLWPLVSEISGYESAKICVSTSSRSQMVHERGTYMSHIYSTVFSGLVKCIVRAELQGGHQLDRQKVNSYQIAFKLSKPACEMSGYKSDKFGDST